jgi:hypothetical protein
MYLSGLGNALGNRGERTGGEADLDAAVAAHRAAVEATPPGHPARAMYLSNLGVALGNRFERTGSLADLDAVVDAGRDAAMVEAASPLIRVSAARGWGHAAAVGGRWQEAVAGFEAAVGLLGRVAPRSLARSDQEHLLDELGGLGSHAAACCVHAGQPGRGVELFEQGRGVLLGQALDTRTDLTALAERYPDLAQRFTALRDELDRAGDGAAWPVTTPAGMARVDPITRAGLARRDAKRRREAAGAFDRVIAEIRAVPGFGGFLRPPTVGELAAAATAGPVVVVTVSHFGSHALILTGDGVGDPLPLPGLTPDAEFEHVDAFLAALDSSAPGAGGRAAGQRLGDTLGWLWDTVTGPVLDRLGIGGPPAGGQPWPRLWWCVSGLLSFLPVHAAGHHDTRHDAAPATVIDRVVSSYTPTVRALAHARRSRPAAGGTGSAAALGGGRVVAVAMPRTTGADDLPGAQAETTGLRRRLGGRVTVLTGPQATHEAVLAALPRARWAHFACHGAADPDDPSSSHLLLADHQQRPLTVADVARLRLDDAELAFLSACSTARPGRRLTDEAIHLASAFQLAGYRHVVGTLWPIDDGDAVAVADHIYAAITTGTGDVAGAVHAATRSLRNRWADCPSVWASHIHAGA